MLLETFKDQTNIFLQDGIDFLLQSVHYVGVCGQTVKDVGQGGAGRIVAPYDEAKSLGNYLVFSQTLR